MSSPLYPSFFTMEDVINATITIARQEHRKLFRSNKANPAITMSPSSNIMMMAMLMEVVLEITLANKSVPPVLVSYLSIRATPIPIMIPPNKALSRVVA